MNKGLYSKLAFEGIKKNKKLYIPYMISIIGMVAIFYILSYLTESPALDVMEGGGNLRIFMGLGKIVMAFFSVFFLFYTNSFLTKRRNSEFALYNILGMNKKNIIRILARESCMIGFISIFSGLLLGILLSKLFEVLLIKMIGLTPDFVMYFSKNGAIFSVVAYAAMIMVLFIFSSVNIASKKPIDLLKSKNHGEKEPRANWVITLVGAIVLGAAYYISMTINNPLGAITLFFVAVIMVIAATYMLFISGSVFVCKALKKNKNYYYSKKHFVSLSGMAYRMKRNGAGLASICILSTMVLVMIASAGSLYLGKNSSIRHLYPNQFSVSAIEDAGSKEEDNFEKRKEIEEAIESVISKSELSEYTNIPYIEYESILEGNNASVMGMDDLGSLDDLVTVVILPLKEYNRFGDPVTLNKGEALVLSKGWKYKEASINLSGCTYSIVGKAEERIPFGNIEVINMMVVVVDDYEYVKGYFADISSEACWARYDVKFDTNLSEDEQVILRDNLNAVLGERATVVARCTVSGEFVEMYASLFLLGIFLSIAFLGACVLIMYYKQITEGYEDANSYQIMRNVGMTKAEIKKSVNSQTLITFFSPLIVAGIHLAFSAPMVKQILFFLGVGDVFVFIMAYVICYLLFAVFYFVVYQKTVKAYVEIVSY